MEKTDFQELWEALFDFKKYSYEKNLLQELESVNVEMHDSNLVREIFDQEKHDIVVHGIHELCHDVLTELSHISTAITQKEDQGQFWKLAEGSVRASLHRLIDHLGEVDGDLQRLGPSLKKDLENYLTHHIRYLNAKTRFIQSAANE